MRRGRRRSRTQSSRITSRAISVFTLDILFLISLDFLICVPSVIKPFFLFLFLLVFLVDCYSLAVAVLSIFLVYLFFLLYLTLSLIHIHTHTKHTLIRVSCITPITPPVFLCLEVRVAGLRCCEMKSSHSSANSRVQRSRLP